MKRWVKTKEQLLACGYIEGTHNELRNPAGFYDIVKDMHKYLGTQIEVDGDTQIDGDSTWVWYNDAFDIKKELIKKYYELSSNKFDDEAIPR